MSKKNVPTKIVDLGVILVEHAEATETVTRDTVYLKHNHMKVFTLTCAQGKPSRLRVSGTFLANDDEQLQKMFQAYVHWKRQVMPDFKLANHSGKTKDGHVHPWRKKFPALRIPDDPEDG